MATNLSRTWNIYIKCFILKWEQRNWHIPTEFKKNWAWLVNEKFQSFSFSTCSSFRNVLHFIFKCWRSSLNMVLEVFQDIYDILNKKLFSTYCHSACFRYKRWSKLDGIIVKKIFLNTDWWILQYFQE